MWIEVCFSSLKVIWKWIRTKSFCNCICISVAYFQNTSFSEWGRCWIRMIPKLSERTVYWEHCRSQIILLFCFTHYVWPWVSDWTLKAKKILKIFKNKCVCIYWQTSLIHCCLKSQLRVPRIRHWLCITSSGAFNEIFSWLSLLKININF